MKLLIVEDDPGLARLLEKAAREAGYRTRVEQRGDTALEQLRAEPFDLVVLDLMLPGLSGFDVCRRARAADVPTPILVLTARDAVTDKVEALDAGADDYIVKPFQVAELLARIRALLRRGAAGSASPLLTVADLRLDPAGRTVCRGEKRVYLSATEYTLLEYLMRNTGHVLTRSLILEHVWQYDFGGNDNILDVYIGYLRGKIDRPFDYPLLHTVRGVGFVLEDRRTPEDSW